MHSGWMLLQAGPPDVWLLLRLCKAFLSTILGAMLVATGIAHCRIQAASSFQCFNGVYCKEPVQSEVSKIVSDQLQLKHDLVSHQKQARECFLG